MTNYKKTWGEDETPALRKELTPKGSTTLCPFCGGKTAILSDYDHAEDTGRLELYCLSDGCEAREFTIIRLRGESASGRADVRALRELDYSTENAPATVTLGELFKDRNLEDEAILARRLSRDEVVVRLRPKP